jgi:hypothetical protein
MEGREVSCGDRVQDDEAERSKNVDERRFKVGELVEFWGGVLVRGYRTESGDPAWVKADYGGGEYGIKMVGSNRGKLKRVHWKQNFKDGSFNKSQMSEEGGARVRTTERMRKIEEGKAEVKFAVKVKEKEQELKKAEEEERSEMQQQADSKSKNAGEEGKTGRESPECRPQETAFGSWRRAGKKEKERCEGI